MISFCFGTSSDPIKDWKNNELKFAEREKNGEELPCYFKKGSRAQKRRARYWWAW